MIFSGARRGIQGQSNKIKMEIYSVIGVSRRKARLVESNGGEIEAQLRSNAAEVVCGDLVIVDTSTDEPVITSIEKRTNLLSRSYGGKTKLLAANLDHLFIVSAIYPLFNTVFIDRTIAACIHEEIAFSLIVNKIDQGLDETQNLINVYAGLNISILYTSTKDPEGISPLVKVLEKSTIKRAALCGISGVGKSSLLKKLIPDAQARISAVSEKTGHGRQTTSMAVSYPRQTSHGLQYLIDLPGLQHFGVSHIRLDQLRSYFTEFVALSEQCQFIDCAHMAEPSCAVREALIKGEVSETRYNSYVHMRREIESGRTF